MKVDLQSLKDHLDSINHCYWYTLQHFCTLLLLLMRHESFFHLQKLAITSIYAILTKNLCNKELQLNTFVQQQQIQINNNNDFIFITKNTKNSQMLTKFRLKFVCCSWLSVSHFAFLTDSSGNRIWSRNLLFFKHWNNLFYVLST